MKALSCPKCGAPLQSGMKTCPYCQVGLEDDVAVGERPPAEESAQFASPVEIPPDWIQFKDPWHGFTLAHPSGWRVVTAKGQISVRADPAGVTQALIWPFSAQMPLPARQIALQFTSYTRAINPTFQAWEQSNSAGDSNRITLRTRQMRWGQPTEGIFNILIHGVNVIISGYEAPEQSVAQWSDSLSRILGTFHTMDLMPRRMVQEPGEGAFSLWVPDRWNFQGRVDRNHIGGAGTTQYTTSDPTGQILAAMPMIQWSFSEGMGGILGMLGGQKMLHFQPAAQFCVQNVAPWMSQAQSEMKIEAVTERPDWVEGAVRELAGSGYPPGMFEISMAELETTYLENGIRMRQKSRVGTQRQRAAGMFAAAAPIWMAYLDVYYRAPVDSFPNWEPVLTGIIDSQVVNPAWKMREQQLTSQFIANSQADIQRRTRQISRTLSETSDLITQSYWNRQAMDDRISEMRSNATLGVQNVAAESGEVYKVPSGFDRYWVDGLGNLYGGSWLSQPDIQWKPLEPTGI